MNVEIPTHSESVMKSLVPILLLMLLLNFPADGKLQGARRIDSIRTELRYATAEDTNRARLLANLSFLLIKSDIIEAESLAQERLKLSEKIGFDIGEAICYKNLAVIRSQNGDYIESLNLLYKAEELSIETADWSTLANVYINIGIVYSAANEYDRAISYFEKSLQISLDNGNKHNAASNYNNIASVKAKLKNYPQALEYYLKALEIYTELDLQTNIITTLNNTGITYQHMQYYEKAYKSYKQCLEISTAIDDESGRMFASGNMADLFNELYSSTAPEADAIASAEGGRKKMIESAIEYGLDASSVALSQNNRKAYADWVHTLAQSYSLTGNFAKAYECLSEVFALKDSLIASENKANIDKLEMRKNAELERKEIDLLRKDKEFSTLLTIALSIASLASIIFGFVLFRFLHRERNSNALLVEKNKIIEDAFHELSTQNDTIVQTKNELELLNEGLLEREHELMKVNATKDKFFSIIAHDLRNPLGAMIGASNALVKLGDQFSDNERNDMYGVIAASSEHLYSLLENLLTWARSQTGALEFSPNVKTLSVVVEDTIALHKLQAENKNITLFSHIDAGIHVFADSQMIHTVLRNLVSNAIKFTPEGGRIEITARIICNDLDKKHVELRVVDSGIGMADEDVAKLFRIDAGLRGFGTNNERGTGLGLIICREFVEKNGGTIWASSKLNVGTTFAFTLPLHDE